MGVRRFGRVLRAGLIVWGLTLLAVLGVQFLWPERGVAAPSADAVICLGAGMSFDGWRLPDDRSLQRALTCGNLIERGAAPVAVFTGYGHELYSAAAAMADAAEAAGAPRSALIVEGEARSTLQNADLSRRLLPPDAKRVIVVSDAYHLPRAWVIFRVMGFEEVILHRVPAALEVAAPEPSIFVRETAALWFNAGRLLTYWAAGLAGVDHDTRVSWFN